MSFLIFLVLYPEVFCFLDRQTLRCFVEDVDLSLESSSQEKLCRRAKIPEDMRVLLDRVDPLNADLFLTCRSLLG
jgi:hypothetical protein